MSGTTTKPFNIGRDCQVVLLWNGTRVNMPRVTGFQSQAQMSRVQSNPLNGLPTFVEVPNGWSGQFDVDRQSADIDSLFAAIESAFWNAGTVGQGTIYQYITEANGSTTTWEYSGVTLRLNDAGRWQSEAKVSQRIEFMASTRTKIS